ncbi:MAG: hypothetical protein PUE00_02595 [Thermobifida fusca]|nr:hypothetical protein [Thermobifida fusca]
MRWVTYLSPSGGEQRPGVVDDGCVFGYPGPEDLPQLLAKSTAALREAHRQALAEPVEIIVEFETRLCAPLVPERPLTVVRVEADPLALHPALVRGTDDGVLLPPGTGVLDAEVGVAAFASSTGEVVGYTLACLWSTPQRKTVAVTLGPALVTEEELDGAAVFPFTVSVDDVAAAQGTVERGLLARRAEADRGPVGVLPARVRSLAAGAEFFVDAGLLGMFELRVGSGTGT